jgi:hypothetical protein
VSEQLSALAGTDPEGLCGMRALLTGLHQRCNKGDEQHVEITRIPFCQAFLSPQFKGVAPDRVCSASGADTADANSVTTGSM